MVEEFRVNHSRMDGVNLDMTVLFGQHLLQLLGEQYLRQLTVIVRIWWIVIVSIELENIIKINLLS